MTLHENALLLLTCKKGHNNVHLLQVLLNYAFRSSTRTCTKGTFVKWFDDKSVHGVRFAKENIAEEVRMLYITCCYILMISASMFSKTRELQRRGPNTLLRTKCNVHTVLFTFTPFRARILA